MRVILVAVGGVMALVGAVWTLQGVGVLPGSFMTGSTFWAVAGLVFFVVGALLCYRGARHGSGR